MDYFAKTAVISPTEHSEMPVSESASLSSCCKSGMGNVWCFSCCWAPVIIPHHYLHFPGLMGLAVQQHLKDQMFLSSVANTETQEWLFSLLHKWGQSIIVVKGILLCQSFAMLNRVHNHGKFKTFYSYCSDHISIDIIKQVHVYY